MKEDIALAAAALALYVLSLVGVYAIGSYKGASTERNAAALHLANVNTLHTEERTKANQRERDIEQQAIKVMNQHAAELQKELENEKLKQKKFVDGVRSGAIRLSIPTRSPVCRTGTGPDTRTPTPDREEARTELDQETASSLVAITTDGDDSIRQLNACIDAYGSIRSLKNQAPAHVQAQ